MAGRSQADENGARFEATQPIRRALAASIERFHDRQRRHSTLDYRSAAECALRLRAA